MPRPSLETTARRRVRWPEFGSPQGILDREGTSRSRIGIDLLRDIYRRCRDGSTHTAHARIRRDLCAGRLAAVLDGEISVDDPRVDDIRALLDRHLAFCNLHSPPEDVHALDIEGLLAPAVTFFSFRTGGRPLAVGALKELDGAHAELKSMHTAEDARGRGIGMAMLKHLITTGRERRYRRLSLETGSMEAFAPARSLYARAGFVFCEPFADYRASPNSMFMTLVLSE